MVPYCVPVLVSLGCIRFKVFLGAIVAEGMFVCSMMGIGNAVPDAVQLLNIVCKLIIFCLLCVQVLT